MKRLVEIALSIAMLLISWPGLSKTSDQNEAMEIKADSVEIQERQGISIYRGDVVIKQGSTLIKGELIHIYQTNNTIERITIEGSPASFRQLNDDDNEILAQSLNMEYQNAEGILVLKKQAILVQQNNRFTSEHIVYNARKDIVQAGSNNSNENNDSKQERVTITIQPEADRQPQQSEQE